MTEPILAVDAWPEVSWLKLHDAVCALARSLYQVIGITAAAIQTPANVSAIATRRRWVETFEL